MCRYRYIYTHMLACKTYVGRILQARKVFGCACMYITRIHTYVFGNIHIYTHISSFVQGIVCIHSQGILVRQRETAQRYNGDWQCSQRFSLDRRRVAKMSPRATDRGVRKVCCAFMQTGLLGGWQSDEYVQISETYRYLYVSTGLGVPVYCGVLQCVSAADSNPSPSPILFRGVCESTRGKRTDNCSYSVSRRICVCA